MSQAALPSNPAPRSAPGLRAPAWLRRLDPRLTRLGLLGTGIVLPVAVVALAGGPRAWALWRDQLAHVHPHAPRLALLERVWATHPVVILHMSCAFTALVIGTALMAGVKGTAAHRTLGYAWSACMLVTAVSSFWIRTNHGQLSFIHFLSGWTTIAVPLAIALVRRRQVRRHARMMTSVFVGGLLVAGALTFLPGRLMFQLFLG